MTRTFVEAAAILLREGLEALLVIAALAAYLKKAGAADRLAALYGGALIAVLASVFAAWLFEIFNNGVHNDLMEAGIMICAAVLMLYVSGWLMLRQDPRAWQGFLRSKVDEALAKQTGIAVAVLAFLAVFREGAETVLFIHALALGSGGWSIDLLAGLFAASIGLVVLFGVINYIAAKLPLRPLFVATSAFLFFMAIKFTGQSIQELQEQQIVPYTELRHTDWLAAVGFNPTLEGISTQLVVVVLAVLSFLVVDHRGRKSSASVSNQAKPS
ncbi:MAG: FTR1 family protein [Bradyrhizobium sp.]|uniref:FTR1 family iron permease n=1 Tax=Bradyrhizobium sp. TaxID=376 RepID=UPI0029AB8B19|nr:FTR1 family protein [Bradyrhizobium sp.]MDX3966185.1 FTR1 family protein [Bradyrhizobium sp.]